MSNQMVMELFLAISILFALVISTYIMMTRIKNKDSRPIQQQLLREHRKLREENRKNRIKKAYDAAFVHQKLSAKNKAAQPKVVES